MMIDMQELMMKVMMGDFKSVFLDHPPGLAKARECLINLVKDLKTKYMIPTSRILLSGFSQGTQVIARLFMGICVGSMLSLDVALHLEENPAGVGIFSGVGI